MLLVQVTENPTRSGPKNQKHVYVILSKWKSSGRNPLGLVGSEAQHCFPSLGSCHFPAQSSSAGWASPRNASPHSYYVAVEVPGIKLVDDKLQRKRRSLFKVRKPCIKQLHPTPVNYSSCLNSKNYITDLCLSHGVL